MKFLNRKQSIIILFDGSCSDADIRKYKDPKELFYFLKEYHFEICRFIEKKVREIISEVKEIDVIIEFHRASIEWTGEVKIWLDWMARLGGAVTFLLILRDAVRYAVNTALKNYGIPNPQTNVYIVYLPAIYQDIILYGNYININSLLYLTILNTIILLILYSLFLWDYIKDHTDPGIRLLFITLFYLPVFVILLYFWSNIWSNRQR